jgi:hypothetical protein
LSLNNTYAQSQHAKFSIAEKNEVALLPAVGIQSFILTFLIGDSFEFAPIFIKCPVSLRQNRLKLIIPTPSPQIGLHQKVY